MSSSISIFLSLFILLLISNIVYIISKKNTFSKIPYTVLLVISGIFLGILSNNIQELSFITKFNLTPDILFYIFLPVLIFESAYNFQIRKLYENIISITLLSTVGLLISGYIIGLSLFYGFQYIGVIAPLNFFLLFGFIISATDPIAVLSLFKTLGAPKRLTLIFEGESLFNDGTAVAAFTIVLMSFGVNNINTLNGSIMFSSMIIGGVVLGYIFGKFFSYFLNLAHEYSSISISIMLVMAHIVFLVGESINIFLEQSESFLRISPIIATTIASLVLGNNGKLYIAPKTNEFIEKYWEQIALMINSLIFILIGTMVVNSHIWSTEIIIPSMITLIIIIIARILSVIPITFFINKTKIEFYINKKWTTMLCLGDVKGALAVIVILMVPNNLSFEGWSFYLTPKELLLNLTLITVLYSVTIKSSFIQKLIEKLKILELSKDDQIRVNESLSFLASLKLEKLEKSQQKGYIDEVTFNNLKKDLEKNIKLNKNNKGNHIFSIMLKSYAIGIERYFLQEIYSRGEISHKVYRRILLKLEIQQERVKHDIFKHVIEDETYFTTALIADYLDGIRAKLAHNATKNFSLEDKYTYYRALIIISKRAIKELSNKNFSSIEQNVIEEVIKHYNIYIKTNEDRLEYLNNFNKKEVSAILLKIAKKQLLDLDGEILEYLKKTDFISSRVYCLLNKNN